MLYLGVSTVSAVKSIHILDLDLFFFFLRRETFQKIYLFLAVLVFVAARAFSGCGERELLFVAVHGSHLRGFSCCRARALEHGLSRCGAWV